MNIEEYFNLSQIEWAHVWFVVSKHSCNSFDTVQAAMERARLDWLCNGRKLVQNCNLARAALALSIYNQTKKKGGSEHGED